MPASAVERDHGMRAGRDLRADLREMQVHRLSVDLWQDQRRTNPPGGTDGAKDVGPFVSLIARLAGAGFGNGRRDEGGEVFLCASCAAASCAGWRGRVET